MRKLTRRAFTVVGISLPFWPALARAATALPVMKVTKDPNCGCCAGWVDYLRENGFRIEVAESADLQPLKQRLGVPDALQSCHTAEIGGYVIEGHVPSEPIRRLLTERPQAIGLAVPGMPASSPGMDVPGSNDAYDVVLFARGTQRRYARYRGRSAIKD
jgi:hypothetical protein